MSDQDGERLSLRAVYYNPSDRHQMSIKTIFFLLIHVFDKCLNQIQIFTQKTISSTFLL